jgi:prepilin-type N-terminal cleavage/methylation domain-containing protein
MMNANHTDTGRAQARGFTLLEMMIALAILATVIAVVIKGITDTIQRKSVENLKIDLVQESREFMDQITNDIHQSGYPSSRMFDPTALGSAPCPAFLSQSLTINGVATTICPPNMALGVGGNGLNSVTATSVQFEADVDGTGVSEVFIQLVQTNGAGAAACSTPPCVIQRGTISKAAYMGGSSVLYYTELNNVMNTTIFTAYNNTGTAVALPATTQATLANITDIGITLYVKAGAFDTQTGQYPTTSMISDAKIRLN